VHQLVCRAFHGLAPEGKPFALHRNGDKIDNRAANLYWGDAQDNTDDRVRHGRSKLTPAKVVWVHTALAEGWSQDAIAAELGVHQTLVSGIALGKVWRSASAAVA